MKEFFIIYNINTGFQTCGSGTVDHNEDQDGTTRAERIVSLLAKNADNRVAYFPLGTTFDSKTQRVVNGTIVSMSVEEIEDRYAPAIAEKMLRRKIIGLFEMVLSVWQVGISKGVWSNADLPADIRSKAVEWKQHLDKIQGI